MPASRHLRLLRAALFAFAVSAVGCAPAIGDSCQNSTDCSANGDRICDTAQPGGYCTIIGCDPDSCPGTHVCVEWRFEPSRTAVTYCMRNCNKCGRTGYECVNTDDDRLQDDNGEPIARVIDSDRRNARFCAAVSTISGSGTPLMSEEPADYSVDPDAGM